MSWKEVIRVGVVGCGTIAQMHHIPALQRIKAAQIVAICDRDSALLSEIGKRVTTAKHYNDFSDMLSKESPDVVNICTPPQTHYALCIEAAKSGCHIMVEKPAALTVEEFDQVAEACLSNGVKLCQIQNQMFEPVVIRVRQRVERGEIGDVLGVHINVLSRRAVELAKNPEDWHSGLPAGAFTEILPHPIYLTQVFLGAVNPASVYIRNADPNTYAASIALRAILEGKNAVGVISCSGPATKDKTIIDINGTRKNLRIDLWNSTEVEYGRHGLSRSSRALENLEQSLSILKCSVSTAGSVVSGRFHSGHSTIIRGFIDSVQNQTDPPISINEAREVIRVLQDITQMAAANVTA